MSEGRERTSSKLEQPIARALIALVLLSALGAAAFAVWLQRADGDGGELIGIEQRPSPAGTAVEPEPNIGALDDRRPIIGQPAPDFALREVDGDVVRLSELRGSVVFINFWATWCRPCKKELPEIQRIYDEKRQAGLVVLAIDEQEPADDAQRYWDDGGYTMPLLLDRGGSVFEQYRLQGLPDSVFIDREGRITGIQFGQVSAERMREKLSQAGLP
jgi:peroxiredoxin